MPSARNLIQEIESLRIRNPRRKGAFGDALRRLDPILAATRPILQKKRLTGVDREFVRYTPVALVACVEGYFKGLLCEFLNLGPPFLQNALTFKDLKVTLEGLVNTHTKSISVGELLSHALSISTLEDIDRNMTVILAKPFLKELKTVEGIPSKHVAQIPKLFETRHILAHEIAPNFSVTPKESFEYQLSVFAFMLATEHYIRHTVIPGLDRAA